MPEDCPTCNQPIYDVRGAIAEMGKIASERDQLKAEIERLRQAIQTTLDDSESQPGGWGPDITMQAVLRKALEDTKEQFKGKENG